MGMNERYYAEGDSDDFFENLHEEFDCEPVALPKVSIRERILDLLQEPMIWYVAGLVDAVLIILTVRYLMN